MRETVRAKDSGVNVSKASSFALSDRTAGRRHRILVAEHRAYDLLSALPYSLSSASAHRSNRRSPSSSEGPPPPPRKLEKIRRTSSASVASRWWNPRTPRTNSAASAASREWPRPPERAAWAVSARASSARRTRRSLQACARGMASGGGVPTRRRRRSAVGRRNFRSWRCHIWSTSPSRTNFGRCEADAGGGMVSKTWSYSTRHGRRKKTCHIIEKDKKCTRSRTSSPPSEMQTFDKEFITGRYSWSSRPSSSSSTGSSFSSKSVGTKGLRGGNASPPPSAVGARFSSSSLSPLRREDASPSHARIHSRVSRG
mmetsp:Transcript_28308/g.64762  ORF Transcript_28308/g.64762 Transcript_28308/m.64762 type:complete len:313 (+) Transcript_28308:1142-2080(+)